MADAAPRSFVTSLAGLLTGIAAVISAGVAAYNIYKREQAPPKADSEVVLRSFEANPLQIAPGEALVLRWQSEHANTCSLDPGIGAVGANGTRTVKPAEDMTYTLRCRGPGGEVESSVSVSVVARAALQHEPVPVVRDEPRAVRKPDLQNISRNQRATDAQDAEKTVSNLLEELRRNSQSELDRQAELDRLENAQRALNDSLDNPPPQQLAYHCCDMYGVQRCPLVSPVIVGTGCFCPYQGTGISCP